jgi:hypothetical protein
MEDLDTLFKIGMLVCAILSTTALIVIAINIERWG